jgi:hypothetical protein
MIPFHRLLISTAIVFFAGFAAWSAWSYNQSHSAVMLVLALGFTASAVAALYYLRHLNRFLGR